MSPLIFITMASAIAVLGTVGFLLMNIAQNKKMHNRALSVIRGQTQDNNKKNDKNIQDKRRAEIARKLQDENAGSKKKKKSDLKQKLIQAGMTVSVKQFWLFSFLFAIGVTLLMLLSGRSHLVIGLVGFTAFFGAPRMFLKWKIKRRQKKFLEDFADALEAMVRLLKAGMPVGEAIAMASREFEGPIGEEMSRIYDAQKIGVSLSDATLDAARRMPITEMQMFATGIAIQAQTGSSLSEVLTNLARVIRARFRLKRKIQALSSEAKASAMIIGSLPFLIGGGLYLINRQYMALLFDTWQGHAWLIGSAVWMTIGCLVMRAMINFKI
jgi:tight adherence protein B